MRFSATPIPALWIIEPERKSDDRGYFARTFCVQEFAEAGLDLDIKQMNVSYSRQRGTLRGMHYQVPPFSETKVVRCTRGSIYDVALDLRSGSATFGKSYGVILSSENQRMLHIPDGCAHGFISMEDDVEIIYLVSQFYSPSHERGIRYNDPLFSISWPNEPKIISEKDACWPDYIPFAPDGGS